MKKLLFIGLAATAMLASCSNDETVEMAQPSAIGFSNAFVNNGTRSIVDPSFTKETLGNFAVYGFTQNGQIFDGTTVTSTDQGVTWTYSPLQYWVADNTYTFGAIAPASVAVSDEKVENGKVTMTVASFTNDGKVDLLHAAPAAIVADANFVASPSAVSMTFNHQLSKVKFSFANEVGEGYNIKVTNVNITDAKETGTLTIGAEHVWSAQTGTLPLDFGDAVAADATTDEAVAIANGGEAESYNEQLMIPTGTDATYTVTFTAELLQGTVSVGSFNHTVTIKDVELKLGYCYDFKATLTHENIVDPENPLKPIVFTVEKIENWNNAEESQTLEVPAPETGA